MARVVSPEEFDRISQQSTPKRARVVSAEEFDRIASKNVAPSTDVAATPKPNEVGWLAPLTESLKGLARGTVDVAKSVTGAIPEMAGGYQAAQADVLRQSPAAMGPGAIPPPNFDYKAAQTAVQQAPTPNPMAGQTAAAEQFFAPYANAPSIQANPTVANIEYLGNAPLWAKATKLASDVGQGAPSVAAAIGGAMVGGPAGAGVMGGALTASPWFEKARKEGLDEKNALAGAAVIGGGSAILNSIPFLDKLPDMVPAAVKGRIATFIAKGLAEAGTETAEGGLNPFAEVASGQRKLGTIKDFETLLVDAGKGAYAESGTIPASFLLGGMIPGGVNREQGPTPNTPAKVELAAEASKIYEDLKKSTDPRGPQPIEPDSTDALYEEIAKSFETPEQPATTPQEAPVVATEPITQPEPIPVAPERGQGPVERPAEVGVPISPSRASVRAQDRPYPGERPTTTTGAPQFRGAIRRRGGEAVAAEAMPVQEPQSRAVALPSQEPVMEAQSAPFDLTTMPMEQIDAFMADEDARMDAKEQEVAKKYLTPEQQKIFNSIPNTEYGYRRKAKMFSNISDEAFDAFDNTAMADSPETASRYRQVETLREKLDKFTAGGTIEDETEANKDLELFLRDANFDDPVDVRVLQELTQRYDAAGLDVNKMLRTARAAYGTWFYAQTKDVNDALDMVASLDAKLGIPAQAEETSSKPAAEFVGLQERPRGQEPIGLYNIPTPDGGKTTVTAETAKSHGFSVPEPLAFKAEPAKTEPAKQPWEMTREEYDSEKPPLKPRQSIVLDNYGKKTEVVQNPTNEDIARLSDAVRKKFPDMPKGEVKLRQTRDEDGNEYVWQAHEGMHGTIEPMLQDIVDSALNQNAQKKPHRNTVYDALLNGKEIPPEVLAQYPEVVDAYNSTKGKQKRPVYVAKPDFMGRQGDTEQYSVSLYRDGKLVGDGTYTVSADGTARIGKIHSFKGANSIGADGILSMRKDLMRQNPKIKKFVGDRVTGATAKTEQPAPEAKPESQKAVLQQKLAERKAEMDTRNAVTYSPETQRIVDAYGGKDKALEILKRQRDAIRGNEKVSPETLAAIEELTGGKTVGQADMFGLGDFQKAPKTDTPGQTRLPQRTELKVNAEMTGQSIDIGGTDGLHSFRDLLNRLKVRPEGNFTKEDIGLDKDKSSFWVSDTGKISSDQALALAKSQDYGLLEEDATYEDLAKLMKGKLDPGIQVEPEGVYIPAIDIENKRFTPTGTTQSIGDIMKSIGMTEEVPAKPVRKPRPVKEVVETESKADATATERMKEVAEQLKSGAITVKQADKARKQILRDKLIENKYEKKKEKEEKAKAKTAKAKAPSKWLGGLDVPAEPAPEQATITKTEPNANLDIETIKSIVRSINGDPWVLSGPRLSDKRQQVMSALKGAKVPKSQSGVTAIREELRKIVGVPVNASGYTEQEMFKEWASSKPQKKLMSPDETREAILKDREEKRKAIEERLKKEGEFDPALKGTASERLAGKDVDTSKDYPEDFLLDKVRMAKKYTPEQLETQWGITKEEATMIDALINATGIDKNMIYVSSHGRWDAGGAMDTQLVGVKKLRAFILSGAKSTEVRGNPAMPLHEVGHVFRNILFDEQLPQSKRGNVTLEDIEVAKKWAGATEVEKGGGWNREAEEKFTLGLSKYIETGEAPTPALKRIFQKVKNWMDDLFIRLISPEYRDWYKGIEITPEIKDVFDRMFGKKPAEAPQQSQSAPASSSTTTASVPKKTTVKRILESVPSNIVSYDPATNTISFDPSDEGITKVRDAVDKALDSLDVKPALQAKYEEAHGDIMDAVFSKQEEAPKPTKGKKRSDETGAVNIGLAKDAAKKVLEIVKKAASTKSIEFSHGLGIDTKNANVVRVGTIARLVSEGEQAVIDFNEGYRTFINEGNGRVKSAANRFKEAPEDMREMLNKFLIEQDPEVKQARLEALPEPMRESAERMRTTVDALSRQLRNEGVASKATAEKIENQEGYYLRRTFKIFKDPDWKSQISEKMKDAVRKHIANEEELDPSSTEVTRILNGYMNIADNTEPSIVRRGKKLGTKDLSTLQKRGEFDQSILDLWGVEQDGIVNFLETLTAQANLIANHRFLRAVARIGEGKTVFSADLIKAHTAVDTDPSHPDFNDEYDRLIRGNRLVPFEEGAPKKDRFNPSEIGRYGAMAGSMVERDFKEAMQEAVAHHEITGMLGELAFLNSVTKAGMTALSPKTASLNFWSNSFIAAQAHHLFYGSPKAIANRMRLAMKVARIETSTRHDKGIRTLGNKLIGLGVLKDTIGTTELQKQRAETKKTRLASLMKKAPEMADSAIEKVYGADPHIFKSISNALGMGVEQAFALYQAGDDVWKTFGWLAERDMLKEAYPNWSERQLDVESALRVRRFYTTYSELPNAVKTLRHNPLIAPFVAFYAEVPRGMANTMLQAKQDIVEGQRTGNAVLRNQGLKRAGSMMVAAATLEGISQYYKMKNDVDDDDEETLRMAQPSWDKAGTFGWYDIDRVTGKAKAYNLSAMVPQAIAFDPLTAFFRAETIGQGVHDFAKELASPLYQPEIGFMALRNQWYGIDSDNKPIFTESDPMGEQWYKRGAQFWKDMSPGAYKSVVNVSKAEDKVGKAFDELSGQRTVDVDLPKSLFYKAIALQKAGQEQNRDIGKAVKAEDREAIMEQYKQRVEAHKLAWREASDMIKGMKRFGVDDMLIVKSLKEAGLDTPRDRNRLINGNYVEPKMPDWVKKALAD